MVVNDIKNKLVRRSVLIVVFIPVVIFNIIFNMLGAAWITMRLLPSVTKNVWGE